MRRGMPWPMTLAAGVLFLLAVPVATWWLVGDLSTAEAGEGDYAVRPPDLPDGAETAAGAAAAVLVVGLGALLAVEWATRSMDRRWGWVLGCLAVAGALVALVGRMLTAGVVGANIGAGLAVVVGTPILFVLVLVAAVVGAVAVRDGRAAARAARRAR